VLKKSLLDRYNPDVFLAVSTENGCPSGHNNKHSLPPGNNKPDKRTTEKYEKAHALAKVDWLSLYPTVKSIRVDAQPPNATHEVHGVALPSSEGHNSMLSHVWRMYVANEAKRQWEEAVGWRYDVVVKLRPDWVCGDYRHVAQQVELVLAGRRKFAHYNKGLDEFQVSDKFIVATSAAFDFYASAWLRLPEYFDRGLVRPLYGAGCECTRNVKLIGEVRAHYAGYSMIISMIVIIINVVTIACHLISSSLLSLLLPILIIALCLHCSSSSRHDSSACSASTCARPTSPCTRSTASRATTRGASSTRRATSCHVARHCRAAPQRRRTRPRPTDSCK
jgi:hypothetical protein